MNAASFVAGSRVVNRMATSSTRLNDTLMLALNQGAALLLLSPVLAGIAFLIWQRDDAPVLFDSSKRSSRRWAGPRGETCCRCSPAT